MPFYTEPRWEEAPEGTTGFLPETDAYWAGWVKKVGNVVYIANANYGAKGFERNDKSCSESWTTRRTMYIPRPEKETNYPYDYWATAPEGTTGFLPNHNEPNGGNWVRIRNDVVLIWSYTNKTWLGTNFSSTPYWKTNKNKYIPRPAEPETVEPSAPVTENNYPTYNWLDF